MQMIVQERPQANIRGEHKSYDIANPNKALTFLAKGKNSTDLCVISISIACQHDFKEPQTRDLDKFQISLETRVKDDSFKEILNEQGSIQ